MRTLIMLLLFFIVCAWGHTAGADELSDAYLKEYTFLKAQKNELAERLQKEQKQRNSSITISKNKVRNLQDKHVILSRELKEKENKIEKARETLQNKTSNKEIINSVTKKEIFSRSLSFYYIIENMNFHYKEMRKEENHL